MRNRKGFTLIELLVVIGILAVLLAITLIAVNPAQNIADAEDTQRRSDVTQILNAVSQYIVDNNGNVPATVPSGAPGTEIEIGDASGQADICGALVPQYIAAIPQDPTTHGNGIDQTECTAGGYATGYSIRVQNGRVTVYATGNGGPIQVTR